MRKVNLRLGGRGYPIIVGRGILNSLPEFLPLDGVSKVMLVSDSNVWDLYGESVSASVSKKNIEVHDFSIPPGEGSKSFDRALKLISVLAENSFSRSDAVLALGGGVVGDLAGFAASIYKRGIKLIQIPTSLMAQVDSAIGGKTGVDLPEGKNLVGSFYQPVCVICDTDTLYTLPERELKSGLSEVIKYFLLRPQAFKREIIARAADILRLNHEALEAIVFTCTSIKARIVEADEQDRGIRAILNYGHTLGHALEAATGYSGEYTHGEAVSVGMVFAGLVGERLGISEPGLTERHKKIISAFGLPVKPFNPALSFSLLVGPILQDKKARGSLTMVLLRKEGEPIIRRAIDIETLAVCYEELLRQN